MKKERIIFTVTNDLTFDQRMHRICTTLQDSGYDVLIIGRKREHSKQLPEKAYLQKRLRCFFNRHALFYAEFNIRLFFYLLFIKSHILSAVDLDTLPAVWLASRIKRKPCVYDAHEYFPESPELVGRKMIKGIWTSLEQFLVPKVDAAYTVSPSILNMFYDRYSMNFICIRNVPRFLSHKKLPAQHGYMLYQGALNVGRGLEEIISLTSATGLELWLAGEGDLSSTLREIADEKAPGKVKFLGLLSPEALKPITSGALFGINLLRPLGESYRLSLSNKFFDYIMAEVPQLCIDFEEYRRINESRDVALLVADLKEETLLPAILKLKEDEALRCRLIANCRKAKKIYNWEVEEPKLINLYQSLGK
ncbi:MAG: glycosyltransferase family 4 protein [Bacteroidetes bacterium]|nr:glycosyltransferase family 4 protein [Bacteroidota bacterium]